MNADYDATLAPWALHMIEEQHRRVRLAASRGRTGRREILLSLRLTDPDPRSAPGLEAVAAV